MKTNYNFSKGKRGAIDPISSNKTRITLHLDNDILDWLRQQVHLTSGGNYQTLINEALRQHIQQQKRKVEPFLTPKILEQVMFNLSFALTR
ncbi:MAG: BrnA antitoxin family protein [Crocosphaera sp.]|nr:BrnA antitoxin family protein [Crocosphaera sp.]